MNLEESDLYKESLEKNTRNRKKVMYSIILCAILIVIFFAIICFLKYQDSRTEKLFFNDKQVSKIPSDFYQVVDNNSIYVNIKELAELLNYKYTKGQYNKYNEDEQSCCLQNDFEIVSITAKESKYEKILDVNNAKPTLAGIQVTMKNDKGYTEVFDLVKPIKYIDSKIYVSIEDASEMLNVKIDWSEYRFRFYTLDYLIANAQKAITQLKYTEMSGYYENLKSILYDYVIVSNGNADAKEKLYGVVSLKDKKEIISVKYNDIKFVQNVKEFYVTASNGTMGILDSGGSTIIAPSEYENISLLDAENQLYLVEKNDEYGVVNRRGDIVVYPEYDEIGIDISQLESESVLELVENPSVLLGKVIPVKKDGQYGLYNINGEMILETKYDTIGCKTTSKVTTSGHEESVVVIPPSVGIKGVVISQGDSYGIFDVTTQKIILPLVCSKIYAITKSGKTTYYMEYNEQQKDLSEHLKENNLVNVDENGNEIDLSEEIEEDQESQETDNKNVVNNTTSNTNTANNQNTNISTNTTNNTNTNNTNANNTNTQKSNTNTSSNSVN